jgi:plasmid stability protein
MASITIRRLDDAVKAKLRARAAHNRRSMEEEAREILRAGLRSKTVVRLDLASLIRSYIEPLGGVDLTLPPRGPIRRPPEFAK